MRALGRGLIYEFEKALRFLAAERVACHGTAFIFKVEDHAFGPNRNYEEPANSRVAALPSGEQQTRPVPLARRVSLRKGLLVAEFNRDRSNPPSVAAKVWPSGERLYLSQAKAPVLEMVADCTPTESILLSVDEVSA